MTGAILGRVEGTVERGPVRAVLFDVDFTLAKPGPELGPEGYRRAGERHGLRIDPARYDEARAAALETLQRHPELAHDEEIWIAFTERIVRGMGGDDTAARAVAEEITRGWELHDNFELYEDVLPVFDELRAHGVLIGLVSNSGRDIDAFVAHHALGVDAAVTSAAHGKVKPDPSIFRAVLEPPRRCRRRRQRWSATRRPMTSRERARSACARSSSTATTATRMRPSGCRPCSHCPAALGAAAVEPIRPRRRIRLVMHTLCSGPSASARY